MAFFPACIFPSPPSVFLTVVPVVGLISWARSGLMEVRGVHMKYSKFWNSDAGGSISSPGGVVISSRKGMLLMYTPAFLVAAASLAFAGTDARSLLLSSALTVHFLKRILEVLFIHRYSGVATLDTVMVVSVSYAVFTAIMVYSQSFTQGLADPPLDLKFLGVILFLVGIAGNCYHHYLLAKLRTKNGAEGGYTIPQGGLFGLVACPHYLFEIIGFVGISFTSQTLATFSCVLAMIAYLMGRSYATRQWYLRKFEDFPVGVKALIPFVF